MPGLRAEWRARPGTQRAANQTGLVGAARRRFDVRKTRVIGRLLAAALCAALTAPVGAGRSDTAELLYQPPDPKSAQNPAFSPDGSTLLFTRFQSGYNSGDAGLYKLALATRSVTKLLFEYDQMSVNLPGACWNGPTDRIAFSSDRQDRDEIWTMKSDGTDLFRVTRHTANTYWIEPSFSPDGQWIVFEEDLDTSDYNNLASLYKVRADGSGLVKLIDGPATATDNREPNWSPTGDRIVFQRRKKGSSSWNLFTMAPDGSEIRQITWGGEDTDASFSPDGQWVVYSSDQGNLPQPNIFIVPATGGTPRRVTYNSGSCDAAPSWSPDGEWIAFESQKSSDENSRACLWRIRSPIRAGTPNQWPLVTIVSPTNGQSFAAPATFTVAVRATDPDGTVTQVTIFNGGTQLGRAGLAGGVWNYLWSDVAAGSYNLSARARDDGGAEGVSSAVGITVTGAEFRASVNFQPSSASLPSGYLKDGGAVFGARGQGYTYGWSANNAANMRDRNASASPDQRYDTLAHMQKNGTFAWEIAVPNGRYSVHVVAGDPGFTDSVYRIAVEGAPVVDGRPNKNRRWIEGTAIVSVQDGRLTISNAPGAKNNKICFVDVRPAPTAGPLEIYQVKYFAYQIQRLQDPGAVDKLAESRYDMLVLEPTRTDWSESSSKYFDTRAMCERLKASRAYDGRHRKLLLAYLDIGEAEDWRWYWTWSRNWPSGNPKPSDWPGFIIGRDPDGWAGCYPVAFWDPAWKDLVIYGSNSPPSSARDYRSALDEILRDGFDGVYLDWVEAFADDAVVAAAARTGVDPALEMIRFIGEIRDYGRARNPAFLVVQQNAAGLLDGHPELIHVIDGISQEDIWYLGEADAAWSDASGHDIPQDAAYTRDLLEQLGLYLAAGVPVFDVEYTVNHASEIYARSRSYGFVPYCSRVSLEKLTTTPPY